MNIMQKVSAGIVSASMLAAVVSPMAFAADVDVTVSGNGADSTTVVEVEKKDTVVVSQSTTTIAVTAVVNKADTGNNKIIGSTGEGKESIKSGNAEATTTVTVTGGSNAAEVQSCGCESTTTVGVTGNGADSSQMVKLKLSTKKKVLQASATEALTEVVNKAKTGNNKIKNSTGSTANKVVTGSATSTTEVVVEGGSNVAGPSVL